MSHTLGAFCPNILFPYARETLDSLVVRGSFPALMLAPVNFDALYAQELQRMQQARNAGSGSLEPLSQPIKKRLRALFYWLE